MNKLVKRISYILSGLFLVLVCLFSIHAVVYTKSLDETYRRLFSVHTRIFTPEVPESAGFAGEPVPLDLYYVKEALEREIMAATFMHSSSIMMFKRSNRWFPVIEPILKKNGIPDDFKYLVLAESNLANVVSPAGAEGYWQFIKPTGQKYGLEITPYVDERYHMEKATNAACKYLNEARKAFGSWTLAAAAYNRGMDGMNKAVSSQKSDNYYNLYLNDETSRYIYRILALKEVYLHPVKYGFFLREQDFYPQIPTRIVAVDSAIADLPLFAKRYGISYRTLRELNPWIRDYSLPNKTGKIYTLLLPKDGALLYENLRKKLIPKDDFFHDTLEITEVY